MTTDNSGVIKASLHRFILAGTIAYTVLVLYFMFLGFNRIGQRIDYNQYEFLFVQDGIPLRFPKPTMSWLYDFGNIAAFIPFGIIIPLLYRVSFRKFITLFILVISFLEVLQSLTKGSVTFMINGEEFLQFSDQDKDSHMWELNTFYEGKVKDVKIIVTGNAKVWDVSIAEIKHWWE